MKKIYFAVSDIHGCYSDMIKALDKVGFMKGNSNHILIVVGDAFDRGHEQLELFNFFMELEQSNQLIYILGNHDMMLIGMQSDPSLAVFNYMHNGLDETIHQIFGVKKMVGMYKYIEQVVQTNQYKQMRAWLSSKEFYFETEDYIFAHAGLPDDDDWRKTMNHHDTWIKTWMMLDSSLNELTGGKFLVCGHWHAYDLRARDSFLEPDIRNLYNHETYFAKNGTLIALDGCTNYSHLVNVLVIEQEEVLKG